MIKVLHIQERLTLSKQAWSPVIMIDNTNVQKFEIYPYIQLANRYRYSSCHTSLHKLRCGVGTQYWCAGAWDLNPLCFCLYYVYFYLYSYLFRYSVLVLGTSTLCVCVCMCICICICICSGIQCSCLRRQPPGQRTRMSWPGETRMESPGRSLPRGSGSGNHCRHCKVQSHN